jgi:hypothetical protein
MIPRLHFYAKCFNPTRTLFHWVQSFAAQKAPHKVCPLLQPHLARLALAGDLLIEDPDLAARHYLALINADIHYHLLTGQSIDDSIIEQSSINGVRTFLMAFGKRS